MDQIIEGSQEYKMKEIETIHAEGHVICHDITVIIKDEIKDTAFRKGHIVTKEDIPKLLSLGKDHLYVWEKEEGMLHENEAAKILASVCRNQYMRETPVKEGKIELVAESSGGCHGSGNFDRNPCILSGGSYEKREKHCGCNLYPSHGASSYSGRLFSAAPFW